MKTFSIIVLTLIYRQFAHASFNWLELFKKSNDLNEIYDEYHFTQNIWNFDGDYSHSLESFSPSPNNDISTKLCGDRFFPSHPKATTKSYHYALYKYFDYKKLPPDNYRCNLTTTGKVKTCLNAGALHFIIISDTFFDLCGNSFRGFWAVAYNSDDENMGTLLSKGRNIESVPGSPFKHDYRPSNTYEVSRSNFIFMSPLFKKDQAKIDKSIKSSAKSYNLIMKNSLFTKRR